MYVWGFYHNSRYYKSLFLWDLSDGFIDFMPTGAFYFYGRIRKVQSIRIYVWHINNFFSILLVFYKTWGQILDIWKIWSNLSVCSFPSCAHLFLVRTKAEPNSWKVWIMQNKVKKPFHSFQAFENKTKNKIISSKVKKWFPRFLLRFQKGHKLNKNAWK